jgi:hypothetical protein
MTRAWRISRAPPSHSAAGALSLEAASHGQEGLEPQTHSLNGTEIRGPQRFTSHERIEHRAGADVREGLDEFGGHRHIKSRSSSAGLPGFEEKGSEGACQIHR